MNIRSYTSVRERREALSAQKKVELKHIGSYTLDEQKASLKHCENMIGAVQVPLGIAGPLRILSEEKKELDYFLPLATTEGALIASINRGCKAITESGGCFSYIEDTGTTRGPVFETQSMRDSIVFAEWIKTHISELDKKAKETSSHISLIQAVPYVVGTSVFVRFSFTTGDAMGMNMVTIASQHIADWLEKQRNVHCLSVSGNACVDKKPSWMNTINGRGIRAWSEVFLSTNLVTQLLKTTPEQLIAAWQAKCLTGGALFGIMGANGHAANCIAALYLATGQDIAHVVEGSQTITTMKLEEKGVRVSVYLPSVMAGTVGGGTGLDTQKEALSILGIDGGNDGKNKETFARIAASCVLAGEISELAALSAGLLTKAHVSLAR